MKKGRDHPVLLIIELLMRPPYLLNSNFSKGSCISQSHDKRDSLTIEIAGRNNSGETATVFFTDVSGRKFISESFTIVSSTLNKKAIDTGKLKKGIYVLEIIGSHG